MANLLEVDQLKVSFRSHGGEVQAVRGVSFRIEQGEVLAVVGESGCGKSVTAQSIMKLLPKRGCDIKEGRITFLDKDLLKLSSREMKKIKGSQISMIFQDPMTSLNPTMKIGVQIAEAIIKHKGADKRSAKEKAIKMLKLVGIPNPTARYEQYPHELSGGMRQRVMIAIALSCNPELLIADEPTTALDVTIQAQILDLMKNLQKELDMGIIMITHDLAVVSEMADTVLVMYAGKAVEYGSRTSIFNNPLHPYTQGLMKCIPDVDAEEDVEELFVIKGSVPSPDAMPAGCRFADRCPYVQDICRAQSPDLEQVDSHHTVSCWKYTNLWEEGEKNGPAISEVAVGKSS